MEKKINCPFCGTRMENICPKCFAYRVTEETHNLPLNKQPYCNPIEFKRIKMRLKNDRFKNGNIERRGISGISEESAK